MRTISHFLRINTPIRGKKRHNLTIVWARKRGDGVQDVGGGGGGEDTAHVSLVSDDRAHKVKCGLSVTS